MATVTISIPDDLKAILDEVDFPVYLEALKMIARNRIVEKENRLAKTAEKSAFFERKYNQTFSDFSRNIPDDPDAHEDWINWAYLNQVHTELSRTLEKCRMILKS